MEHAKRASGDTLRTHALNNVRNVVTSVAEEGSNASLITKAQLEQIFERVDFASAIFRLFDHEAEGSLYADKVVSIVKQNLSSFTSEPAKSFVQLFESCIELSVKSSDGKLMIRDFERAIGSQNLGKQLFEFLKSLEESDGISGQETINVDHLLRFLRNLTTENTRVPLSQDQLNRFAKVFKKSAKDSTLTLDEFSKMVSSKNRFFVERAFKIINRSGTGKMNLDEYTETLTNLGGNDTDAAIHFLFNVYDKNGDGELEFSEVKEALRASTVENGMTFDVRELDDMVLALFEDAGVPAEGRVTFTDLKTQLNNHGDFSIGLADSIVTWCSPVQRSGSRKKDKFNLKNYLVSNKNLIIFMFFFLGLNIGLFIWRAIHFSGWKTLDGKTNVALLLARANGITLNLNSLFVLIFVLRYTITIMRKLGLVTILPLDQHIFLHKFVGILIFVQGWFHGICHYINFAMNVNPNPVEFLKVNKEAKIPVEPLEERFVPPPSGTSYNYLDWMFTTKPGLFGLVNGCANITGFILIIALTIMVICSMPFVRRSGHFEIFYFSHLLYFVYFTAMIFHAPSCWWWMITPLIIFVVERTYRLIAMCTGSMGKSEITEGIVLPSKVTGLVIKKPTNFKFSPGDWVFVKIPEIANFEWHPFTISSAPEEQGYFTLHVRGAGGWTNKLYEFFEQEYERQQEGNTRSSSRNTILRLRSSLSRTLSRFSRTRRAERHDDVYPQDVFNRQSKLRRTSSIVRYNKIGNQNDTTGENVENGSNMRELRPQQKASLETPLKILIDGPFGAPASNIFRAKHAVLIATGIGVTPFSSILQSIMHRFWANKRECPNCNHRWTDDLSEIFNLTKVDFFWINRDQRSFEWFVKLLTQLEIEQSEKSGEIKRFLDMHMYITSALQKTDMRAVGLQLALDLLHKKEKRDLITGLTNRTKAGRPNWDKVFKDLKDQNKGEITVFYCGNPALAGMLQKKCETFGFIYRKEVF